MFSLDSSGAAIFAGDLTADDIVSNDTIWTVYLQSSRILNGDSDDITASIDKTTFGRFMVAKDSIGITQAEGFGILLINPTASTAGLQQYSPPIEFYSEGYKTGVGEGSKKLRWRFYAQTLSGAPATGKMILGYSYDGGVYSQPFILTSAGALTILGGATLGGNLIIADEGTITSAGNGLFIGDGDDFVTIQVNSSRRLQLESNGGAISYPITLTSEAVITNSSGTVEFSTVTPSFQAAGGTGTRISLSIKPTYNQTGGGTIANTDLLIQRTETALGTGEQNLVDMKAGSSSKFRVNNKGDFFSAGRHVPMWDSIATVNGVPEAVDTLSTFVILTTPAGGADQDSIMLANIAASRRGVEITFLCTVTTDAGDTIVVVPATPAANYASAWLGLNSSVTFIWSGAAWFVKAHYNGVLH
uniref:Uncharacterized protein n=1 Tax=viral metagenome TaxID=1070528 RepID=A0A6M3KQM0_9ZZZZ